MEFFGFLTWLFMAAACSVGEVFVTAPFRRSRPRRWIGLGVLGVGLAATAGLGAHLHHVYWLDEPLFIAAAKGDLPRVRALLAAGACPDATWEDGTPALAVARRAGQADVVAALRHAGAVEPPHVLGVD